jgi:capsular polysaccharide biosynthesis protein
MLSEKEQQSDASRFWEFVSKNIKVLLLYAIIGGCSALVITFFLPKEYKSYGIVYPPSSTSIENSIDFPNFGYDIEADRLIEILNSSIIRDAVVNKFDLANYYEIDKSDEDWLDQLMKKYYKNIKFERTPSMSILITARTKDANLSADIVNFIISAADELREKIYKKNIIPAYENARLDYELQKHIVDSAEYALTEKLKNNKLSSLLMLTSDAQLSIDIDQLSAVKTLSTGTNIGSDIIAFKSAYEIFKEYKSRFIRVKKTYTNPIPKIFVINYAEPNFKKVSPFFTINIAVGILFSLCVAVAVFLIRHNIEDR